MYNKSLLILSTFLFSLFSLNTFAQEDPEIEFEKMVRFERETKGALVNFREINTNTEDYDLKYARAEWQLDPSVRYISGEVTFYFKPTANNFNEIYFDLSTGMTVNLVTYHGGSLSFTQPSGDQFKATFTSALPIGQLDSVTINYEGNPPTSGFGSFGQQTVCSGSQYAIWTLSEPYGARDWWPTKQTLNDKIDSMDIFVTVPPPNGVGSNGILVNKTLSGTDTTFHWKHRYPIPAYLVAIAVTDYVKYSDYVPLDGGGQIEVLNYVFPCSETSAKNTTPGIIPIMQLYIDLFGDYPFENEKYGHAQFGWGGGMEHSTMTFMGGFSHYLMAHELAHQWFGDQITCQSWEDIWLNEGFATYIEGMTYEHNISGTNTWSNWKESRINHVTGNPDGSVWCDDTTSVGRIFNSRLSYSKGALLLHMIRWKIGDTDFFQAINNYLADASLAYGYATTDELKTHFETVSGIDLTEFFNDWFTGQGWPTYDVNWSQNASNTLTVTIDQTQSNASVSFFEMPVPIRFSGAGKDTILVFDHTFDGQVFNVPILFSATSATFDPDKWLCAKNTISYLPVELTKFNVKLNSDNNALLTWETASESNTKNFEIERSFDAFNFIKIKEIIASGNSLEIKKYSFVDNLKNIRHENIYYRLKINDINGDYNYSSIKNISIGKSVIFDFSIIPNPNTGIFSLNFSPPQNENIVVEIFNHTGQTVFSKAVSPNTLSTKINLNNVPSGTYLIKISSNNNSKTKNIIIK